MGSGTWKTIQAVCFLLLLLGVGSAKNPWKQALQARLHEKSQAEEAGTPGLGPRPPRADRCPPPPRSLPPGACQVVHCQGDAQCLRHKRCCYNGCAYACLEAVPAPPGYECHILSPGDMAKGIPNRGQCVKQRRQADGRFIRHKFHREYPEGDSKNVAEHGHGQRHVQ